MQPRHARAVGGQRNLGVSEQVQRVWRKLDRANGRVLGVGLAARAPMHLPFPKVAVSAKGKHFDLPVIFVCTLGLFNCSRGSCVRTS